MDQQVFQLLWPFFRFCKYLGLFPCERCIDEASGSIHLIPIYGARQLLYFLLIGLPIFLSGQIAMLLLFKISEESIADTFECLMKIHPAFGESLSDSLVMLSLLTFSWLTFYFVQWANFKTKNGLQELSRYTRFKRGSKKILKPFIIQSVMICLYPTFMPYLNFQLMKVCAPSVSVTIHILLTIPSSFSPVFLFLPILIFMGITSEIMVGLMDLCHQLKQTAHKNNTRDLLNGYNNLLEYVELSKKVLSPNNFFIATSLSVQILCFSFFFLFHLVNKWNNMTFFMIMLNISHGFYLIMVCSILWFLNIWSERATDKIHEMKRIFRNRYISNNTEEKIEFEGQFVPPLFMKARIEQELDEFRGFDGKGYFILGKSFLKNLLAFCVTYLVILIQFRLTEDVPEPKPVPDPNLVNGSIGVL